MVSRDTLITVIDPDPEQPRKVFDEATLAELAESMAANGLAVPILVRPTLDGRFLIVHGERRWRAAQRLGWESIPAEVRELTPDDAHWLSLVENVQRSNLSPIEEAQAFQARLDTGLTQEALGQRIGKHRTYVAQKLRLLTLPSALQYYLNHGALSEGHARELLTLRGLYGADHLQPTDLSECPVMTPAELWDLFVETRPLDYPSVYHALLSTLRKQPPVVIGEAAQVFLNDWVKRCEIPAWEMTAFWYASAAIAGRLSVVTLTHLLTMWRQSIQSAIGYLLTYGKSHEPPDPVRFPRQAYEWWEYRADLRHAGLLEACQAGQLMPEQCLEAMDYICEKGLCYPSSCQAWGPCHQAYAAEIKKEEERRVGWMYR
jgi:ParB/RepB/Spo0J family partition protein